MTPQKQFADLSGLRSLPETQVTYKISKHGGSENTEIQVECENTGKHIAFGLKLVLNDTDGNPILPVFWEDNYFSLLPGERRTTKVRYNDDYSSEQILVNGWNFTATIKE